MRSRMGEGGKPSTGTAELRAQMDAFLRGDGDPRSLVEAVRDAELLLPLLGEGPVWTADLDSIRWLFAFTGTREMHTFLQQRWEAAEPGELNRSGFDEIEDLTAELGWIAAGRRGLRRLLDGQLSSNPTPSEPGHTISIKPGTVH
ncbi:hypothetical protein AB0I51_40770 [Streptomyces sp. NPDC050549]|uniref:hypothetical protein n=1 Tax=Streptomyces sp. NPDC050549 TaxID=3155406 RepID=UPI00342937BB